MKLQEYWKAIVGALTPGAVVIVASLTPQSEQGSTITTSEWLTALCAVIITGAAVAFAPANDTGPVPPNPPEDQPMFPEQ